MSAAQVEIGIGGASLWGAWETSAALADDLDARVIAVRQGPVVAILAAADVMLIWKRIGMRVRQRMAGALGIPRTHIGIVATQTHGAPMVGEFCGH